MKKKSIVLLVLLICVVMGLPIVIEKMMTENLSSVANEEYVYQTFEIDKDKWGYEILHFDKKIIKQNYIPAIGGRVCFRTEAAAGKTAKLVITKLNRKEMPALTKEELEKLGVIP